jgi:hypothetical protein
LPLNGALYAKEPALRIISILIVLLISGCTKNYNNEVSTYKVADNGYQINLTGMRGNMAHDPISFVFRGSSEISETLNVPRISGVVKGNEIPTEKGYYKYLGFIHFSEGAMVIELQYDNYDDKTTPDSIWNGNYILQPEK